MAWTSHGRRRSAISDRRDKGRVRANHLAAIAAAMIGLWAGQADASGWETTVKDSLSGVRTAGILGTTDDKATGLVLACSADGDPPPRLTVAVPPTRDFRIGPGDSASVRIAGAEFSIEVMGNDSAALVLAADLPKARDLLDKLGATGRSIDVKIVAGKTVIEFTIPDTGLAQAISEIETACHL